MLLNTSHQETRYTQQHPSHMYVYQRGESAVWDCLFVKNGLSGELEHTFSLLPVHFVLLPAAVSHEHYAKHNYSTTTFSRAEN